MADPRNWSERALDHLKAAAAALALARDDERCDAVLALALEIEEEVEASR